MQAKYLDPSVSSVDMTNLTNTIIGQIGAVGAFNLAEGVFSPGDIGAVDFTGREEDEGTPMAFLNAFVFDEYFNQINLLSKQITSDAREDGSGTASHEKMELPTIEISESGYVYIYLSNEQATLEAGEPIDVFFDDFTVTQHHTPIVSKDDYYPFGGVFASYARPAATAQNFKYNNFEYQQDLGLNLYDYLARQYDPFLGRFTSADPAADLMRRHSPYNYAFDNPIRFIDPDGMMPEGTAGTPQMVWNQALGELEQTVNTFVEAVGDVIETTMDAVTDALTVEEGNGESQAGGLNLTTEGEAVDGGTRTTSDSGAPELDGDGIQALTGGAGMGKLSSSTPSEALANGAGKVKDAVKEVSEGAFRGNGSSSDGTGGQSGNTSTIGSSSSNKVDTSRVAHFVGGTLKVESFVIKGNDTLKHKPMSTNVFFDYE